MSQPRANAVFRRAVVMQILVERRGDNVLHRRPDSVSRESRAHAFAESSGASAVAARMAPELPDSRLGDDSTDRRFTESGVFPVAPVWMRVMVPRNRCGIRHGQAPEDQNELNQPPHADVVARGVPPASWRSRL